MFKTIIENLECLMVIFSLCSLTMGVLVKHFNIAFRMFDEHMLVGKNRFTDDLLAA